jgi:hypothetical protein
MSHIYLIIYYSLGNKTKPCCYHYFNVMEFSGVTPTCGTYMKNRTSTKTCIHTLKFLANVIEYC